MTSLFYTKQSEDLIYIHNKILHEYLLSFFEDIFRQANQE